jgi:archaemetzincin
MPVFLLDPLDAAILDQAILDVSAAGISEAYCSQVRSEVGFVRHRNQWRADILLNDCKKKVAQKTTPLQLALFITGRDLFVRSLNFVFGLAMRDLQAAIVSWHRLKDLDSGIFAQRLAKEIVHEVGHLKGLEHCQDSICVMWFSNTLSETDRKSVNFCKFCRQKIV